VLMQCVQLGNDGRHLGIGLDRVRVHLALHSLQATDDLLVFSGQIGVGLQHGLPVGAKPLDFARRNNK
jgi:hypothetical protein